MTSARFRPRRAAATAALALGVLIGSAPVAVAAHPDGDLPAGEAPVYLEGIGVDTRNGVYYVSATNKEGAVYRGELGSSELEVFVGPRSGDNGRGIAVNDAGIVFVAGGPSAEVRVISPEGDLLAELPTGAAGSFLNDLWVGPDGSVYVTDSSLPKIWRVMNEAGDWQISEWLDVSGTIQYTASLADFDLGGIVTTANGQDLLVAQGTTGQLWRINLATQEIAEVDVEGDALVNADGLVRVGNTLYVVQNFKRQITELSSRDGWASASTDSVTVTPTTRTFTTAKFARGRLLLVDSKFGFPPAAAGTEDRIVQMPLP